MDTKQVEMLIALHICSFLMFQDSGYTSLSDSETNISNNQIKQSVQGDVLG